MPLARFTRLREARIASERELRSSGRRGPLETRPLRDAASGVAQVARTDYFCPINLNQSSSVSTATSCFFASASLEPAPGPATR